MTIQQTNYQVFINLTSSSTQAVRSSGRRVLRVARFPSSENNELSVNLRARYNLSGEGPEVSAINYIFLQWKVIITNSYHLSFLIVMPIIQRLGWLVCHSYNNFISINKQEEMLGHFCSANNIIIFHFFQINRNNKLYQTLSYELCPWLLVIVLLTKLLLIILKDDWWGQF